jgi:hypothetical protein
MAQAFRVGRLCRGILASGILGVAACGTPADFADGVNSFSQAVAAADNASQSLYSGAQKASRDLLLRDLPRIAADRIPVSLDPACDALQVKEYTPGSCTLQVGSAAYGQPGVAPPLGGLTRYAAKLAAVVADKTCATLRTDAQGLAATIGDLAKEAKADVTAQAGAISGIASVIGCAAVAEAQLDILRKATAAADPIIAQLVPLIIAADHVLYADALTDAYNQANMAAAAYNSARGSVTPADMDKARADLAQALTLTAAIDTARGAPPDAVIAKIATLHKSLTDDLHAPTVSLARFQIDAQAFLAEAQAIVTAADTLAKAKTTRITD